MNIHTQLCTVAHRSMWYFHELKIALLPSYNTVKENLKNKFIKTKLKIIQEDTFWNYYFFLNLTDKETESKKKKKRSNLILNDFNYIICFFTLSYSVVKKFPCF